MSPSEPDRVASIFMAAVDLDDEARGRYLAEACGGDDCIRREVEALLAHDRQRPSDFLEGGATHSGDDQNGAPPVIAHYECRRVLGRGGQAVVWLARDVHLGRFVALKVIERLGPGMEGVIARFKREAAVASSLRHQGICAVHEAGIADGVAFIAMQYIEGETMAQRLSRRAAEGTQLSAAEILEHVRIVESLARALHVAHEAGIVHRDIKPANVMIDGDGHPVILDFGLARQDDSDFPTLTRTGNVFGTPAYMSPEQISGRASQLDRRTDVWSLGVVLYESLTLQRPFVAPTPERLYQAIVSDTPSVPRRLNRAVARDLDVIVGTALEKSPSRRYRTALDLAEDIRRVREHEPIVARPPTLLGRFARWTARRPGLAGGLATAFVALAAGLVVSLALLDQARDARELSQRRAYRSAIAAAGSAAELHDAAALRRHLDDAPPELRGWEWRQLRFLLDRSTATIRRDQATVGELGLGSDGTSVLVASADGTIAHHDLDSGELRRTHRIPAPREGPWYLPGARRALIQGNDHRIVLWDLEAGREIWSVPHAGAVGSPLSSDGLFVVLAVPERLAVRVLDTASGSLVREVSLERPANWVCWEGEGAPFVAMTESGFDVVDAMSGRILWSSHCQLGRTSADLSRVFAVRLESSGRQTLVGYELANGREAERYEPPGRGDIWDWSLDPPGETVCVGLASGALVLWDRGQGTPRDVILAHEAGVERVRFTPDGARLVTAGRDGLKSWSAIMSGAPWVVATPGDGHHLLVNSPDGRRVATTRWGDVVMFDAEAGCEVWTRWLTQGSVAAITFDATSRKLAVATNDGTLRVLDATDGAIARSTRRGITHSLAWSRSLLVAAEKDGARVVDDESLAEVGFIPCPAPIRALVADGAATVAVALENGEVRLHSLDGTAARIVAGAGAAMSSALAFSRDGRLLATGAENGAVAVWDTESARKLATMPGASTAITALVFDPVGRSLVGADEGRYVRIWDVASGSELRAMRPAVYDYAPPSAWWDGSTLRLGDRQHPIVAFEERTQTEGFERRELVRKSRALVIRLTGSGAAALPAADVVARIEGDAALPEAVRNCATAIARARGDDLNRLNGHAWEAVRWPPRPEGWALALRQATEVCRQLPDHWPFLNTLALAQHRCGRHAEALASLDRCEQIRLRAGRSAHPSDLAIAAMAEHASGRHDRARARLDAARSTFFEPSFGRDTDTLQLIREAEALLGAPGSR